MRWFDQANQISSLQREVAYLTRQLQATEGRLEVAEAKNALLDKEVLAERARKDKFVNKFCDQLSVQQKLHGVFVEKEPVKRSKPVYTADVEMQIEQTARMQREVDEQAGLTPLALEDYADLIREDPEKYLPH